MNHKSSALGDFARLLSPISGHPAAHAAFLTEEVIKFPELMALVHPTNVVSAMFSLLGTGNADKFSSLWKMNSQRSDVTAAFSAQLPERIASSLGHITPTYFERELEALDKIPSLVAPLNTGLQQGLTRLANADWASSVDLASAVRKALEPLGKRPDFFVADNDDQMTALKQIIAKLEEYPQQHQRHSTVFSLPTAAIEMDTPLSEIAVEASGFSRLLSPVSGHPVVYASFIADEVIKFPELMALVHPTNVVSAMFSLLGTGNADKFSSLWEMNSQRSDVIAEFSTQLPENIASSLGTITPVYFERKLEALDKIPSLVSPLNTGLQQGLTRLANADWASSINLPLTVESALEHLGKRPSFFAVDDNDRMTALKQIIVKLESPQQHQRPSAAFSLLTGIAKKNPLLPEVMIDAAEQNKSAISDPYRCHEVETFISGLRRLAPAVPTAA